MPYEPEISFGEFFAPLRHQAAFITIGLAVCWATLLVMALAWPTAYRAEGTLTLGNTPLELVRGDIAWPGTLLLEPTPPQKPPAPAVVITGMPVATYRKALRSVTENAVSKSSQADSLVGRIAQSQITAIAANGRTDLARMENSDVIVSVHIAFESSSEVDAKRAVREVADRLRDALIAAVGRDQIRRAISQARLAERNAEREKIRLTELDQQLERLALDLEPLGSRSVASRSPVPNFVDPRERGYFFLPIPVQIDGIRSAQAHNRQAMHVASQIEARQAARLAFFLRLDQRLESQDLAVGGEGAQVPELVDKVLDGFVAERANRDPVGPDLVMDVEAWQEELGEFYRATELVQPPVSSTISKAPMFAGAALAALVLVLGAAVARDTWLRSRATRGPSTSHVAL